MLRRCYDALLWCLGSCFGGTQNEGVSWFWGREAREERFIDRVLRTYPGLADRRPTELRSVAVRVLARLRFSKITLLPVLGAILAAYATTPIFIALWHLGVTVPRPAKMAIIVCIAVVAVDSIRRWLIRRELARAVATVFPDLFCPCGYSRIGLPPASRCPECGR